MIFMKNILIALVLGFILFSNIGFSEVFQYSVNAEIFDNNTALYRLDIIYVNNPRQEVSFTVENPLDIRVESQADCKIVKKVLDTQVVCSMNTSQKTEINIDYVSDDSVRNRDGYFLYADSFKMDDDVKTLSVLVKLPEATGLSEPIENSYSPSDALIGSDGRRLVINWINNDLKEGDMFDVSIAFEKTGDIIPSGFPIEYILVVIIVSFSAFSLFYQFYLKNRGVKVILPVLKSDEKTIFNTIMKHGSGVNQKVIVRDSGYSKAKVSKVLNSLKERGLVKLERIGRSNKVYIEKNFEKKA
jgi:uncharacterized membrane protein